MSRDLARLIADYARSLIPADDMGDAAGLDEQEAWRLKYWSDPVGWARDHIRWRNNRWLAPHQQDIMRRIPAERRVAAYGPRGFGKTATAAVTCLWFITTRDGYTDWKIATTAGGFRQLEKYLWPEIHKWARCLRWDRLGRRAWARRDELMTMNLRGETGEAFAVASDDPSLIEGAHASQMLFIFDESKSIADGVFDSVEGMLTGAGLDDREAFLLAISTPGGPIGRFFSICDGDVVDGQFKHKQDAFKDWSVRPVEIEEAIAARMVNPKWAQQRAQQWGINSTLFRCHVLGKFASTSSDGVIPSFWAEEAQGRRFQDARGPAEGGGRVVIAVDVARGGCFDDQTEILTDEGWKFFENLSGRERVLTLNGDVAEWGPITEIHRYPFDGHLNLFESKGGKNNFCITDNHRLLVAPTHHGRREAVSGNWKTSDEMKWRLEEYQNLPAAFLTRKCSGWAGVDPGPFTFVSECLMPHGGSRRREWAFTQDDWFEFLGWFVSEGNVTGQKGNRSQILISQKHPEKLEQIKSLLCRMGLQYRICKDGCQFTNHEIGKHLDEYCGSGAANKRVPRYVKEAPPSLLEVFLTAFNQGDGWQRLGLRGGYCSSSRLLIDDVQEMLVKIGRSGRMYRAAVKGSKACIEGRDVERKHDVWAVTEISRDRTGYIEKKRVRKVPYKGFVHCVSTPLQTIMVRRGGSTMWSGNSNETVIMARRGWATTEMDAFQNNDTMEVVRRVQTMADRLKPAAIVVDVVGVGAGVFDRLRELDYPVVPFHGGSSPPGKDSTGEIEFANYRSWAWWRLRELLHPHGPVKLSLLEDQKLLSDLSVVTYVKTATDKLRVEEKDEIEKKLRKLNPNSEASCSPDRGDALVMLFADPDVSLYEENYGVHTASSLAQAGALPTATAEDLQRERERIQAEREKRARPLQVRLNEMLYGHARKNHNVMDWDSGPVEVTPADRWR